MSQSPLTFYCRVKAVFIWQFHMIYGKLTNLMIQWQTIKQTNAVLPLSKARLQSNPLSSLLPCSKLSSFSPNVTLCTPSSSLQVGLGAAQEQVVVIFCSLHCSLKVISHFSLSAPFFIIFPCNFPFVQPHKPPPGCSCSCPFLKMSEIQRHLLWRGEILARTETGLHRAVHGSLSHQTRLCHSCPSLSFPKVTVPQCRVCNNPLTQVT